jgi:hypothetical protein
MRIIAPWVASLAVGLCLGASPANAANRPEPKLPDGITCEMVRSAVAEHGKIKAAAMAIEHGATWDQLRAARKCLGRGF